METLGDKIMAKLEALEGLQVKLSDLDLKLGEQAGKLDQLQTKVDLSMTSICLVQQDQAQLARSIHPVTATILPTTTTTTTTSMPPPSPRPIPATHPPPPPPPPPTTHGRPPLLKIPGRDDDGLMGPHPGASASVASAPPFVTFPSPSPQVMMLPVSYTHHEIGETGSHKPWLPKLDFPKFDGTNVRIWLDKCQSFFNLYQISHGFKVQAAAIHMTDNATHWYQAFKLLNPYHDWDMFRPSVLGEFEVNTHRIKLMELLSVR